ncbi:Pyrroline-5-carboxylate reductase [Lysobacter dokdonensis DS-58]|uniref:Pyrroline-5-carboxylate reductase n=1 Tax=Lysobacter dokdonensis DS-58 TaxID=1300345 RepID=A0A0A2WXQ1_9GAMM|nr:pyrroline-5-carboxylate reductase [Lysobacter dokdonensis]KGQ17779.1 Pyrroline-5-carboxylate reductase [Lysobacter dokdonensis DS-58]
MDNIAFIGGGNMARSLIGGLVPGRVAAASLHVAEPVDALRDALARDFGVHVSPDNATAARAADTWVLGVKPQVLREVCEALSPIAQGSRPLIVSIAAGITTAQLDRWLGGRMAIVRAMPNTPALVGAGVTGLFANARVHAQQRERTQHLLNAAGRTVWIDDEARMDAVTAVSGSGPAYVFLLAEAMQAAGEAEGLSPDAARVLAYQTILGAGRMLCESDVDAAELRRRVTSPNGTTHAAVQSFEADGFRALVQRAVHAAAVRGKELSDAND